MNIISYAKKHSVIAATAAIVAVLIMVIAGRVASRANTVGDSMSNNVKRVSLISATTFRNGTSTVSAQGIVESVAQVDLKSQVSAPISAVNVSVGDSVYAGQTIVVLQNADLSAQLESARASLALAQGQYTTGGVSLSSTKKSAIDTARNAYLTADDSVRGKIDQFLFNSTAGERPLSSYISDTKLLDKIQTARADINNRFGPWKKSIDVLSAATSSDADIQAVLSESKAIIDFISSFLNDISGVLNAATENAPSSTLTTLENWKKIVSAARSSISASGSSLNTADAALSNALSAYGSSAESQVKIAEAGVKNLEAQIAKTVIRSPIAGKVAALPLSVGEFASPGTLIATVVGGGGLEVKAYISGEDLVRVKRGALATIAGSISGTVTSIAPSLSEINRKAEVQVLVSDASRSGLIVGQSVPVSIVATLVANADTTVYRLPIQNVKIVPGAAYVFTIDADSKIVRHAITLGAVSGDFVEIKQGIRDDMVLVTPVYEIEEGQTVDAR